MAQTPYLAKYGEDVIERGYDICFIRPGEKRPYGKDWEDSKHDINRVRKAVESGKADFGVGIKTKKTPLVDIDCYDAELVDHMVAFTEDLCGETLQRTGMAPKTGLVYKSSKPFPKTQSRVFIDDDGKAVKLEVLGDGQQFVAMHIHPDTHKPYRWKDKRHVANVDRADLPELDHDDALEIVEEFEKQARKRGWLEKSTVKRLAEGRGRNIDLDDPFISDKSKVEMSAEDLRAKLDMVPNPDDYETWFHVGMALYHQFDGSNDGLLMWHEWSSQAQNYDSDALDEKWPTFDVEGKKREPLTARFILKQAQDHEAEIAGEEFDRIKAEIHDAKDLPAIKKIADEIKTIAFEHLLRESLVPALKDRIKAVTGTNMGVSSIRNMIRFENPEHRSMPKWLEQYVYVQRRECFYSTKTRELLTHKAFDSTYNRHIMTKKDRLEGRAAPEHPAVHIALNRFEIPVVADLMYLPGEDEVFSVGGRDFINSYSTETVPEVPERLTRDDKWAIDKVRNHFKHLFPHSKRDRKLLLDWLCYIVQTGKRVNWAVIVQGAEGDGKSFFFTLMGAVLGSDNVQSIIGEGMKEKYTAWAEGSQFLLVEEVRLHGPDRYAVLNKVKPYITNPAVSIRRMQVNSYLAINTVNYFLTTNHKDGVPVTSEDSRYYPMFSQWQTKKAVDAFKLANPLYYTELHEAVQNHAGALRKWMMEVKLSANFDPEQRAPESHNRAEMVYLNKTEEQEAFDEALDASVDPFFNRDLMDSARLTDAMVEHGAMPPVGRQVKTMISEHGFTYLGPVFLDGKTRKLWTQTPQRFIDEESKVNTLAIRKFLNDFKEVEI